MRGDSLFSMDPYNDSDDDMDNVTQHSNNKADARKSNKPIMEKRRRARINNCLNDLKGILLEAMRKDPARHSKLEKADILELTVRHLQNIQRNQLAVAMATDPTVLYRFKNGFSECASEVGRYLSKLDSVDEGMKTRVSSHLTSCVGGLQQANPKTIGSRYGSDVPFVPFSPPAGALIPPSNLTPPGDLNNNKETHHILIHRPVPINPVVLTGFSSTAQTTTSTLASPSPPPPQMPPGAIGRSGRGEDYSVTPVDYSTRQQPVVKVEPDTTTPTSSSKDSMWRPW